MFKGLNVIHIDPKDYKFKNIRKINDITIDDVKYKLKPVSIKKNSDYELEYYYNDLIIKHICDDKDLKDIINIECCDIKLAELKNKLVVLVPDYHKENHNYINGYEILAEFLYYLESNKLIEEYFGIEDNYFSKNITYPLSIDIRKYFINKLNNLENIWDALNNHYKDDPKKDVKVSNIMKEFCERFCLDYLVMQTDRHEKNWEIEEDTINNEEKLTPLYDNEVAFEYDNFYLNLKTDNGLNYFNNELEKFLEYSSDDVKNYFTKIYEAVNPNKLKDIIIEIENSRNFSFPMTYKIKTLENYRRNYENIKYTLERINAKRR